MTNTGYDFADRAGLQAWLRAQSGDNSQRRQRLLRNLPRAVAAELTPRQREILELYVNSIYFGDGYEGIGNASVGYFGKEPGALDAGECTLRAGIPNAPSAYALSEIADLARQRQCQVLRKLVAYDYLDEADARRIGAQGAGA